MEWSHIFSSEEQVILLSFSFIWRYVDLLLSYFLKTDKVFD